MCEALIKHYNKIYKEKGFRGVIEDLHYELYLGRVIEKDDGLYCIITCGWCEDEARAGALTDMCSIFGNKHYVGYLRGGAYYFAEEMKGNDFEIILQKELKEQ